MDPFQRLPPELISLIILQIADFAALENLLCASARVRAVLQAQPTIVHDLLASNSITCIPEIQRLCYNMLAINTSHCADLAHYEKACQGTPEIDSTEAFCLILLAARVQRLACACLTFMQHNFVSAIENVQDDLPLPPRSERSAQARKSPSWMEEYRVYSALWHLQHYSTLRKTATGRWSWSPPSLHELDAYNIWNEIDIRVAERIWTVAAVLSDLGLKPSYERSHQSRWSTLNQEREEPPHASWSYLQGKPIPFFDSFDLPASSTSQMPLWSSSQIPEQTEANNIWYLTPEHAPSEPLYVNPFRNASTILTRRFNPVYHLKKFKLWRRLGLVIWDTWRMRSLELCVIQRSQRTPTPDGGSHQAGMRPSADLELGRGWLALLGEGRRDEVG